MDAYMQYILSQCAQRVYIPKLLCHQNMPYAQLSVVSCQLNSYAIPAWGGFLGTEIVGKTIALFRRAKQFGYYCYIITEWLRSWFIS